VQCRTATTISSGQASRQSGERKNGQGEVGDPSILPYQLIFSYVGVASDRRHKAKKKLGVDSLITGRGPWEDAGAPFWPSHVHLWSKFVNYCLIKKGNIVPVHQAATRWLRQYHTCVSWRFAHFFLPCFVTIR
jgi:hypothetical protein